MSNKPLNRIFGLDLLRSIAILIVVIEHSSFLINNYTEFPFIPLPDGVNLFFVLSGYLIGTIVISITEQNQNFGLISAFNFLKRRWFRTLPNYFLFLIINIILIYFGLIQGFLNKYLVTYFMFLQNFHKPYDFLFWESWSLSIEEWFYLFLALTLVLLFRISEHKIKPKKIILITIIIFLFFPLIYRIVHSNSTLDIDLYFRKLVLTRLDTIGFGLAGAYIHWYYSSLWSKGKNFFFVLGFTTLIIFITNNLENNFFSQTYYYSFIGLSILLILPKLESLKNENIPFKPIQFLSKISYSMYLLHMPLLQIISKIFKATNKIESILVYITFWLITFVLSNIIYKKFELPIMNLRDRTTSLK